LLHAPVLSQSVAVPMVHKSIDSNGEINDAKLKQGLESIGKSIVNATREIKLIAYAKATLKDTDGFKWND